MKTTDVFRHYGSKALAAQAVGVEVPSVYGWGEYPPPLRQLQFEAMTDGTLKAETDCDKYRVPAKAA